jgi:hypothetical protein
MYVVTTLDGIGKIRSPESNAITIHGKYREFSSPLTHCSIQSPINKKGMMGIARTTTTGINCLNIVFIAVIHSFAA